MARYKLRCPDCRRAFAWEDTSALPDYCPLCGSYVGLEEPADGRFEPKAPAIGKPSHSADVVYRQMEAASEERAKRAAELAGVPVSEMGHMKITDMRDNLREGDVAAVVPRPNPVSTFMSANPQAMAAAQAQGAAYAAATRSGPAPGAGDRARQMVGSMHDRIRRSIESQGITK